MTSSLKVEVSRDGFFKILRLYKYFYVMSTKFQR